MMKNKILKILVMLLLIIPFTNAKAISWGMIKNIDSSWKSSSGYSYSCYFLRNGDGQDYNYSLTPTYTYHTHVASDGKEHSTGNYDSRCNGGGFENGQTGLYPLTGKTDCKLLPDQFRRAKEDDTNNVNGVFNGGGVNISYDKWSTSGTTIAECIAGVIIGNSDLSQRKTPIEQNIMIEAKKNSDFLSSEQIDQMKQLDSSFNDDTEFCFVRGHSGDEYATYFGHVYADLSFDGDMLHSSKTKDSDKRELVVIPSSMPDDDSFGITVFPDVTKTMDIVDLKSKKGEMQDNDSVIVTLKGKLVTDKTLCSKEVIDAYIQNDDEAIGELPEDIITTIEDPSFERFLKLGYSKKKAIEACKDPNLGTFSKPKCYKYTFPSTFSHPMYNTTVWTKTALGCGFVETDWNLSTCENGNLASLYNDCVTVTKKDKTTTYCENMTHSGYNGTADFYVTGDDVKDFDFQCHQYKAAHVIYRGFILAAPILTIVFITFDLVSSLMSGDPKKISKFREKLIRRIIALVILIVTPIIVYVLVNTLSKNEYIRSTSIVKCIVVGED